jgi:hypothetical protein
MTASLQIIDLDERAAKVLELSACIVLATAEFVIGRHPECDLVVNLADVSRYHYFITHDHGRYVLRAPWRSPTEFNGVSWYDSILDFDSGHVILTDGDRIATCGVTFEFRES